TLSDTSVEQLAPALQAAVARAGWSSLMPVQARAIPYLLAQRNMMIQARTGSGKTGAFLLPMLERLDPAKNQCQALVLVPTRELARQVAQEGDKLFAGTGLRVVAVYGGTGYTAQREAFRQGAHVIVGTPGRVLDHLMHGALSLNHLQMLIFDEADRMLSMGFYPDMKKLQRYLPDRPLHGCMFSATFPTHVLNTAREFLHEPEFLSLSQDHVHVTDTEHVYYIVNGMDKDRSLIRIIEIENPASAIIFCNTKVQVHYVSIVLQQFGYNADELTSDLSQNVREKVLDRVRKGTLRFLVATDVAARGIDLPALSHVIQYEPPEDFEAYIHRAGRTSRAGAPGVAISLVSQLELFMLNRIANRYEIELIERPLPTDADVEAVVSERVLALLEAQLRDRDRAVTERSRRFIPLSRSLAENEEESAIIAMLLDEYYQQMLHAPVPVPDEPGQEAQGKKPPSDRKRRSRGGRRRS
ncbi:DEAD/DEAH box helicase, partial [bacterium]|nr:DEAD/DEAH box helicase [bacterium]